MNNLFLSLFWVNVLLIGVVFENKKIFCVMNYLILIWVVKSVFLISCFLLIIKWEKFLIVMEMIVFYGVLVISLFYCFIEDFNFVVLMV